LSIALSACSPEAHSAEREQPPAAGVPSAGSRKRPSSLIPAADAGQATRAPAPDYDVSLREGVTCKRPAAAPGLRFHESPLCGPIPALCDNTIECKHHAECGREPHGFCEASVAGVCNYPTVLWSKTFKFCTRDADCDERADGRCEHMITSAHCSYDECASDDECAPDQRCACQAYYNVCMQVDCKTDDECKAGERCLASSPCAEIVRSYNCTTPADACHEDADCMHARGAPRPQNTDTPLPTCAFKDGRFRCVEACIVESLP
jgi:hypothetical protein